MVLVLRRASYRRLARLFFNSFLLKFADVEKQERLFPANLKAGRIRSESLRILESQGGEKNENLFASVLGFNR
jgi:hypothetical protein